jgi:F-type H+-transporting ATPase subunit alpha
MQFGSDLDKATQAQIARGERIVEILKQGQFAPLPVARQVMIIFAGVNGLLDDLPVEAIRKFELGLYQFIEKSYPQVEQGIAKSGDLSPESSQALTKAIQEYKQEFLKK